MREHVVQPGDTPGSIAAMHAGCPKCSRDLIAEHPEKPTVTHPNGYKTFRELRVGERLRLPTKWFDGTLDLRPKAYFAALPYPDGSTPGVGAPNVLTDYSLLDAAAAQVGALALLGDQPFNYAVNAAADAVDASVKSLDDSTARAVREATAKARQYNATVLDASIAAGDQQEAFQARTEILKYLSSALAAARLALQTFYDAPQMQVDIGPATIDPKIAVDIGPATIDPSVVYPMTVSAAAQAAVAAIAADANYCASVARPGSAVNSAVHAFKVAWNSANPSSPVPVGTSSYEQATADALMLAIGHAPVACGGAKASPVPPVSVPSAAPPLVVPTPAPGIGVAGLGLGMLGIGVVGGVIYLAAREMPVRSKVRRVRVRRRHHRKEAT